MSLEHWRLGQLAKGNIIAVNRADELLKEFGEVPLPSIEIKPSQSQDPSESEIFSIPGFGSAENQYLLLREYLQNREKAEWKRVLGKDIVIDYLPLYITPDIAKNLERLRLNIRYIPGLELGLVDDLREPANLSFFSPLHSASIFKDYQGRSRQKVDSYLEGLEEKYPNWRRLESLSEEDKRDYTICRNLNSRWWEGVKMGSIDFPEIQGRWVAVEVKQKPTEDEMLYLRTLQEFLNNTISVQQMMDLGLKYRNLLYPKAISILAKIQQDLLREVGLPIDLEVRMLRALEWNLLGNREGWGQTSGLEMTSTLESYRGKKCFYTAIGASYSGGAGYTEGMPSGLDDESDVPKTFRIAVILNNSTAHQG